MAFLERGWNKSQIIRKRLKFTKTTINKRLGDSFAFLLIQLTFVKEGQSMKLLSMHSKVPFIVMVSRLEQCWNWFVIFFIDFGSEIVSNDELPSNTPSLNSTISTSLRFNFFSSPTYLINTLFFIHNLQFSNCNVIKSSSNPLTG